MTYGPPLPAGRSVTVIRRYPAGFDAYGDPLPSLETTEVIDGCGWYPRASPEVDAPGRAGVIKGLTLFVPYDTDLTYLERVEVDGTTWEVDGEPGSWWNPLTGDTPGRQVALRRREG